MEDRPEDRPKAFIPTRKGAPPKLTPELREEICKYVRGGAYIETACAFVGVSKQALYQWLKRANDKKEKDPRYAEFQQALGQAFAQSELADIAVINAAAQGRKATYDASGNQLTPAIMPNWVAAAWRLERKFPKRWNKKALLRVEEVDPDELDQQESRHEELLALIESKDKESD